MPEPSDWPGGLRRDVPRSSPTYAVRAPLSAWLREEASAAEARHGTGLRVLDVGCGAKPYFPFFAEPREYVGVDAIDNPVADVRASVESLPLPDASFDLVLCLQVLEHVEQPARAVRELRRVVAPGGRVLASTHGVQPYHPAPLDLWRWTHAGLERMFHENGDWASLTVVPASGTAACLGMLLSTYVDLLARRAHVAPLGRGVVALLNSAARVIDRRVPSLREPRPGTVFANYHVTAVAG
jgi:SAM-dependent methyltransferase